MIATIHLALGWESAAIAKGGTQSITNALVSAGKKLGVEYFINSEVNQIIIEEGKAKGIRLADGTEVAAKQMVVGDVGTPQVFARLIEGKHTNTEMKRRLDTNLYDRGHAWWGTIAIHELPQYKAAKSNPDLNATPRTYWAPKDLAYMENKYMHEIFLLGMASKFFCLSAPDSIWDPTRVPEGKHSVLFEDYTCPTSFFSRREWRQLANEFIDALIEQWGKYAPNMTKDNIIGSRVVTPVDLQDTHLDMRDGSWSEGSMAGSQSGRFRGIPGGFRTFIKNFYMCSSSLFGGGGIARGSSYNCYRVIAEDFGLRKPE
jgi:phytoene dehydrogenase-like protein